MPWFFRHRKIEDFHLDGIHGWKTDSGVIHRYFIPRPCEFSRIDRARRERRSLRCGNHYRRELAQSTYTWVTLPSANRRVAMHTSMRMRPASPWNPAIRIRASKRIDVHREGKKNCLSVSIHLSRFCWLEPRIERNARFHESSNDFRINLFFFFFFRSDISFLSFPFSFLSLWFKDDYF